MTRQRKPILGGSRSDTLPGNNSSNVHKSRSRKSQSPLQYYSLTDDECCESHAIKNSWISTALCFVLASCTVLGVAYFLYLGYLETRINTPLSAPKVVTKSGLQVPDRYWGTYRPGLYFGTKVRHPTSPVTGLMWFVPGHFRNNMLALRHWCDQGDDLLSYTWQRHDGRNFGSQIIRDQHVTIVTDFVKRPGGKHGGDWTARISAKQRAGEAKRSKMVSLLYYVALDPDDETATLQLLFGSSQGPGTLMGSAEALGGFRLHVLNSSGVVHYSHYLSTRHLGLHLIKETVFKGLAEFKGRTANERHIGLVGDMFAANTASKEPNFVVFQLTGSFPFEIEVVFESESFIQRPNMLAGDIFTSELKAHKQNFDVNFGQKFPLKSKGFSEEEIRFAKAALSNMIGGIGYFYGSSKVQGESNKDPVPYWKAPLYTAVPSRSFFPRGFLWDEGFHNLLISKWDREISMDIIGHWMDLMNWDGWIPREQILGVAARARVPDEFIIQRSKNANPPTLLLTLHSILKEWKDDISDADYDALKLLWPRLRAWYNWFNTTQIGPVPGSYRWRGRDPKSKRELNPKTLTSGLDDYPRASHPSIDERHLDLRCWMTLACGLLADIATVIEKDPTKFKECYEYLKHNQLLDKLHWSFTAEGYMDYGLHTFNVELMKLKPNTESVRITHSEPQLTFIDSFGYNSFFPLFLHILDPGSIKLGKILEDLRRPDLLWTEFGLRSLARNSPFYMKHNTDDDPPYWRGPIWLNMNYLCVRALYYYSQQPGPFASLASEIYVQLRHNLVRNVLSEYKRTGYFWEQYSDKTGRGQGCRPFTGWTSLILLIMAENY